MRTFSTSRLPLHLLFWAPLLSLSLLLCHNAILYFTHGGEYGILPEKSIARKDLFWNIAFYTHLPAGIFCLLIPAFSFLKRFLKRGIEIHRMFGKMYVWITLVIVCPTGIYLALYAKGGIVTIIGFLLQGLLLFIYTFKAYKSVLKNDRTGHVHYMIRSFAVASVVITFRVLHILFLLLKVPYQDNYAMSQWLGVSVNLLIAELLIIYGERKYLSNIKQNSYETI